MGGELPESFLAWVLGGIVAVITTMAAVVTTLWRANEAKNAEAIKEQSKQIASIEGELKGGQVPSQEIIAELTAATLAQMYCPEANLGFSYEYVKSYAEKSKKTIERACLAVINTVGLVLNEILKTHLLIKAEVA